jgi:hypothetical protein
MWRKRRSIRARVDKAKWYFWFTNVLVFLNNKHAEIFFIWYSQKVSFYLYQMFQYCSFGGVSTKINPLSYFSNNLFNIRRN